MPLMKSCINEMPWYLCHLRYLTLSVTFFSVALGKITPNVTIFFCGTYDAVYGYCRQYPTFKKTKNPHLRPCERQMYLSHDRKWGEICK